MEFMLLAVEELPSTDVLARYGFLGILFSSAMIGLRGFWLGSKWLGNRLFGESGIVTRFLEKQEQSIDEVSSSVSGMSTAISKSVEILHETRALVHDMKEVTQDLYTGITATNAGVTTTQRALWAMADAILIGTPEDRRVEMKKHIEEVKRILDTRA